MTDLIWDIKYDKKISSKKTIKDISKILLNNRGLDTKAKKDKFLKPDHPKDIDLKSVGLKIAHVKKAIKRIDKAIKDKEKVVIYGDYDADGVTATAILWECLFELKCDVSPFIPNRFREGYGLNKTGIEHVLENHPDVSLIITVDNGIVAYDAVDLAKEKGIDVIVSDHHHPGEKELNAHSVIHTTEIGGAGVSWFLSREIRKHYKDSLPEVGIDLACIGTLSDQIPLHGANRSIVKHGLELLSSTNRPGLRELYKESGLVTGHGKIDISTYDVGFVIAPRINAVGRLEDGTDALRLLCTKSASRAKELSGYLGKTNKTRQDVVQEVLIHANKSAEASDFPGAVLVAHESYHEGVIGLAASKLVEVYYRPSIVFSIGDDITKASARSIKGFNIIDAIKKADDLLESVGGHPMAAGFSLKTEKLDEFIKKFSEISAGLLTEDILVKSIKIDMPLEFSQLNWDLLDEIQKFAPFGIGNPTPSFVTYGVNVLDVKPVGKESKHLKLKLEKGNTFDAIAFGKGDLYKGILDSKIDIAYAFEVNEFRGTKSMQLNVKDLRIYNS